MKITTKEKDDISIRKYMSKEGMHIELQVETDIGGAFAYLTPSEAVRLGNALIKAAQPKQKKNAPTEAQKEQRGSEG